MCRLASGLHRSALFLLTSLVAIAALSLLSLSALVNEFGFGDDFIAWMWYPDDRFNPADSMFTKHGRYVLSYLIDWTYGTWTEFGDLWKIRLLGIVGWGLVAAVVYHCVLPKKWSGGWRTVHTSAVLLTPAVGISIGYSVCFAFGWGSALALGSGVWAWRCLEAERWRVRLPLGLVSVVGVAAAYMIYQPVAFFFLFPLLVRSEGLHWQRIWADRWVGACVLFALGTVLYGLIYLKIQAGYGADDAGAHRGSLGPLSWERLVQLYQFLWWGAESWAALLPSWVGTFVGITVLGLSAIGVRRGPGWVIVVVTLFAAVALPLLVREVNFFTRLMGVVYAVFGYLALEGARSVLERLRGGRPKLPMVAAGAFVGLLALAYAGFLHYGVVKPSVDELTWARGEAAALEKPAEGLCFVMPDYATARAWPGRSLGEYGRTISCVPPNASTMVAFVYWERFAGPLAHPDRFFWGGELQCLTAAQFAALEAEGSISPNVVVWRGDLFLQNYWRAMAGH